MKMDFNTYEYSAEQRAEGKWLASKILLIFAYTLYVAVLIYILAITAFIPVGALIPVSLWIIIHFTYRYTSPDYKYVIERGEMRFYKRYGKKERLCLSITLKNAILIAPRTEAAGSIKEAKPKRSYSALPYKACGDVYAILFRDGDGVSVFYFVATADAVKLLKRFHGDNNIKTKGN